MFFEDLWSTVQRFFSCVWYSFVSVAGEGSEKLVKHLQHGTYWESVLKDCYKNTDKRTDWQLCVFRLMV